MGDMENNELHEFFNDSLERCQSDPQFLDLFYNSFMGKSPDIRAKFSGGNMAEQKNILGRTLPYMLVANYTPKVLSDIAKTHGRHKLAISADLYPLWLDSLIEAAKLTDKAFTTDTEIAWRTMMQPGIDYMISQQG